MQHARSGLPSFGTLVSHHLDAPLAFLKSPIRRLEIGGSIGCCDGFSQVDSTPHNKRLIRLGKPGGLAGCRRVGFNHVIYLHPREMNPLCFFGVQVVEQSKANKRTEGGENLHE